MAARFLLLIFLLLSPLVSADDAVRLEAAKKALESSDTMEQFRGYNECKTIYLRSMLDKNTAMARQALQGVIQGGKQLEIDVTKYEADLAKLEAAARAPESIASMFMTPEPEQLSNNSPADHQQDVTVAMRHRLKDARWKENGIELTFDTPLQQNEIRTSKIIEADKNRFRYIVDIDSALLSKSSNLEHKNINRIKIAQFDAKTTRLVIEHNHAITLKPIIRDKTLYIDLNLESTQTTTAPLASLFQEAKTEAPLVAALPPLVTVTPKYRSKKVIVVDPGHGGKDTGAVGNGFIEKEVVLSVSIQLVERLRAMGYTVHMTRSDDTFIELKDRTKFANDKGADLFISVHANAVPKTTDPILAQGLETYFLSPGRSERAMRVAALENSEDMEAMGQYGKLSFLSFLNTEKIIASNKLAIDLQKGMFFNLRKQFPNVRDNGVREGPFWVLVGAQMPAVLVEIGYISHPDEALRITDGKYQKWMVEGLIEGVGRYFANNG